MSLLIKVRIFSVDLRYGKRLEGDIFIPNLKVLGCSYLVNKEYHILSLSNFHDLMFDFSGGYV